MSSKKSKAGTEDYAVGRGKPPAATRFKPGQSGNPGGRKKGSRNYKTIIQEILHSEMVVTENGRKRTVSMYEALILRSAQEALQGDLKARRDLLDRYERCAESGDEPQEDLPGEDQAILDRLSQRGGNQNIPEAPFGDEASDDD